MCEPATTALLVSAAVGAGGAVYSATANKAPKYKPPPAAPKPSTSAAEIQKQKALAAYSTLDTFVAGGGTGLGKPGPKFLKTNSLLGNA